MSVVCSSGSSLGPGSSPSPGLAALRPSGSSRVPFLLPVNCVFALTSACTCLLLAARVKSPLAALVQAAPGEKGGLGRGKMHWKHPVLCVVFSRCFVNGSSCYYYFSMQSKHPGLLCSTESPASWTGEMPTWEAGKILLHCEVLVCAQRHR